MLSLAQRACCLAAERAPLVQAVTYFRATQVMAALDAAQARAHFAAGVDLLNQLPLPDRVRQAVEHDAICAGSDVDPESAIALLRRSPMHPRREHLVTLLLTALLRAGDVARASDLYREFGGNPHAASLMMQGTRDPEVRRQTLAAARRRWQHRDAGEPPFASGDYFSLLAEHGSELPRGEAEQWLQEAVDAIAAEPECPIQAGFGDAVTFTRLRDMQLFQLLNAMAELWPSDRREALFAVHPEFAAAARRYPRGVQSMMAGLAAEPRPSSGGFGFAGGGADTAERELALALRAQAGDPAVIAGYFADALRLFHEDTDPSAPNAAPRIFWPSCGGYRKATYWTGRLEGAGGEGRLNQVPDNDFMPVAMLDFVAGVLRQPFAGGIRMTARRRS